MEWKKYLSKKTTIFSFIDGVLWPQRIMHIKRTWHTQFFAPTEASKKEFWLYPIVILRLFVLGKSVGHY